MTVYNPQLGEVLIGRLIGANFNSTADQQIPIIRPYGRWRVRNVWVMNASTSLTTAAGGIYPAASKSGTPIVLSSATYTACVNPTDIAVMSVNTPGALMFNASTALYFSLTTAQGATATADIYVTGPAFEF